MAICLQVGNQWGVGGAYGVIDLTAAGHGGVPLVSCIVFVEPELLCSEV
jgi:hypothetical protein